MSRLIILLLILTAGLGSAFLLPKAPPIRESAVIMDLPWLVGEWAGEPEEPSKQELSILAKDTEFEKKVYTSSSAFPIHAGIVLSGDDLNNSIHRPERCLAAQGHINIAVSPRAIPLEDEKSLEAARIESNIPYEDTDGQSRLGTALTYYWFVGCERLTKGHYERTFIDMKDRLLRGFNQRWAYITIASHIPQIDDPTEKQRALDFVDRSIGEFIAEVFPEIIDDQRLTAY